MRLECTRKRHGGFRRENALWKGGGAFYVNGPVSWAPTSMGIIDHLLVTFFPWFKE